MATIETLNPTSDHPDLDGVSSPSNKSVATTTAADLNDNSSLSDKPEPTSTAADLNGKSSPSNKPESTSATADDKPPTEEIEPGEKRKRTEPESKGSVHPLWKTSLCSYFRRSDGQCSHGETCRYAHGEEELRPRPDNTWDPTSERAKKMKLTEVEEDSEDGGNEVMMTETVSEDSMSETALQKCLVNLPMKWSSDNLRNYLTEQGILYKSAKKKKGMSVGFVTFETAEQAKTAVEGLEGKTLGNKNLKVADVIPRSFEKKDQGAMPNPQTGTQQSVKPTSRVDNGEVSASSNGCDDIDSIDNNSIPGSSVLKGRSAREVVTPLAHMSYPDQLESKKNSLMQTLKKLTRNARKACPNGVSLPEWILKSREIGGLPCKLEGILESPLVEGYRNKCEFSVGYSLQGKPTVGFSLGNFREGVTAVEEPVDCPNVSKIGRKYAAIFQEFLQESSLPIWNRLNNTGFWRQLTVREGRAPGNTEIERIEANISEVLLMVQVSTAGFDDELVNCELEKMARALSVGASSNSPSLPLTALVIQDHQGISNVAPADAPLRTLPIVKGGDRDREEGTEMVAEARIQDYISNLQFCISPTAFFQVNTLAAEKLYSLAGDWADLGPDTLLFDVCCGTGTIGLTLAHRVGMVVGIEMNASAVADATRNAEINGIKNCRFVCSKAEDIMGSLLKEYVSLPQNEDDLSSDTQRGTTDVTAVEDKITSTNSATGPEETPDCEHRVDKDEPEGTSKGNQESEKNLQSSCTSENINDSRKQFKNVVVIVDPPRVGLHPTVIKALRTHSHLRRLVYISCNPESLVANAIELCTPSAEKTEKGNKNNRGWRNMSSAGLARHRAKSMPNSEPFQPIKAMAVDLFPHTPHCELVMLLER